MTNNDVLFLAQVLGEVDAPDMEPDFNYAVSHNIREAEKVSEIIRDAVKPGEEFKEFEKEMQDLRLKYTNKDPEGNPIIIKREANGRVTSTYDIPGLNHTQSPFNLEVEKCKERFKAVIDKQEKKLEFLKEKNTKADIIMVDKSDWPKSGLSRIAADAVFLMTNPPSKNGKPSTKKETDNK